MDYDVKLLEKVIDIAVLAGKEIMKIYRKDFSVEYKDDNSPLTEADRHSNNVIISGLSKLDRQYPVLSEESKVVDYAERKNWKTFWLVDPIDGTKEFIKKNGEFTVNIALIDGGVPVMGVVYAPAIDTLYYGMKDHGAFRRRGAETVKLPAEKNEPSASGIIRVVASKSHMNSETTDFIDRISKQYPSCSVECVSMGSSLKLCMVADGSADIYPRVAPTMEWDTAAAQAVAEAAGKAVYDFSSFPADKDVLGGNLKAVRLQYNKENLLNPYFVVV